MEKYLHEKGQWIHKDVKYDDEFSAELFTESENNSNDDYQVYFHSNLGSLTVLDRMTGFGYRDTETGYRDNNGNFWLASGALDVRWCGAKTVGDAIKWVKAHANNCVPAK